MQEWVAALAQQEDFRPGWAVLIARRAQDPTFRLVFVFLARLVSILLEALLATAVRQVKDRRQGLAVVLHARLVNTRLVVVHVRLVLQVCTHPDQRQVPATVALRVSSRDQAQVHVAIARREKGHIMAPVVALIALSVSIQQVALPVVIVQQVNSL